MNWSSIYWSGGLPLWLIVILGAALAESLRRQIPYFQEKLSPGCTYFLVALRGTLYLAILFFLSGPTLVDVRERSLPPRLLVLVDTSASMNVRDGAGGRTRMASLTSFLLEKGINEGGGEGASKGFLERLSESYDVRVIRFDTTGVPVSPEDIRGLEAAGQGSDPLRLIRAALKNNAGAAAGPVSQASVAPARATRARARGSEPVTGDLPRGPPGRSPGSRTGSTGRSRRWGPAVPPAGSQCGACRATGPSRGPRVA